jgi:hypothetical protein
MNYKTQTYYFNKLKLKVIVSINKSENNKKIDAKYKKLLDKDIFCGNDIVYCQYFGYSQQYETTRCSLFGQFLKKSPLIHQGNKKVYFRCKRCIKVFEGDRDSYEVVHSEFK